MLRCALPLREFFLALPMERRRRPPESRQPHFHRARLSRGSISPLPLSGFGRSGLKWGFAVATPAASSMRSVEVHSVKRFPAAPERDAGVATTELDHAAARRRPNAR